MKSDINAAALRMLRPGVGDPTRWHNVLTVDPGLGGTGVAFWPTLDRTSVVNRPEDVEVIHELDEDDPWQKRLTSIAREFIYPLVIGTVFIEIPRLWSRDKKSRASASRGDLTKLAMVAGAIMYTLDTCDSVRLVTAFPADWKHQLPKDVVDKRIKRALGEEYPDHAADAVGMGLSIQGVL